MAWPGEVWYGEARISKKVSRIVNGLILSAQEKEFVDLARDATVVSYGIGSILTGSKPRLEIPGIMVIDYEERERPAVIWKMALEQKKGDF